MSATEPCSLCEEAPATTRYGLPVCQPCHDMLVNLDRDLDDMEAADPVLAALGDKVREAEKRWLDGNG